MSGAASSTVSMSGIRPLKSGTRTSIAVAGLRLRTARIVAAQTPAPPSASSSRATLVMTQWRSLIAATASATRAGSPRSSSVGRPVCTAQKPQERVQMLPRIITVAVPPDQHSPRVVHEGAHGGVAGAGGKPGSQPVGLAGRVHGRAFVRVDTAEMDTIAGESQARNPRKFPFAHGAALRQVYPLT